MEVTFKGKNFVPRGRRETKNYFHVRVISHGGVSNPVKDIGKMRPKVVPLTNDLGDMQGRSKTCPKGLIMNYQQGVVQRPPEG